MALTRRLLGVVAAVGVVAVGSAPSYVVPSKSAQGALDDGVVAAVEVAVAKAKDLNSNLLAGHSDEDRDLLRSSKVKSVLIDAATGAVLSVGAGAFVPEGAAPAASG